MSPVTLAVTIASEPATVLYLVTGAVGFIFAGIRRSRGLPARSSVAMLFCKRTSRSLLQSLRLL
jgi:hypothetical protein